MRWRDHYKPLGPNDVVPTDKVTIAVALADKLDQLVGYFLPSAKRPSGSGDPFALRRAALGVIRMILENGLRLGAGHPGLEPSFGERFLWPSWQAAVFTYCGDDVDLIAARDHMRRRSVERSSDKQTDFGLLRQHMRAGNSVAIITSNRQPPAWDKSWQTVSDVVDFLADRLKVALREKGTRHDLIDAVFSLGNEDDLVRLVARVEALQAFLKSDDGANLLRRIAVRRTSSRPRRRRTRSPMTASPTPRHSPSRRRRRCSSNSLRLPN